MRRYEEHKRARSKTVSFWMSPEEYRQMQERIRITGLAKNEFMIRSMLESRIEIRAGKFASDRLSLEVRRLRESLTAAKAPEEVTELLLECRALLEQVIRITGMKPPEEATQWQTTENTTI